jgi:DNA-binding HxlR family transcriptional regulator
MPDAEPRDLFRYAQFCSVARAAEVLGHRWTLLVLRELFLGPQRFSDLRERLRGVSSSVLSERLRELEARGVVASRALAPPAASAVYELTDAGRAFWPALVEIARWGARFLLRDGLRQGDHTEPDWLRGAATIFARREATPPVRVEFRVRSPEREAVVRIVGGPGGTRLAGDADLAPEVRITGSLPECLAVMAGLLDPAAPPPGASLAAEGDLAAAREVPRLFEIDFGLGGPIPGAPPH